MGRRFGWRVVLALFALAATLMWARRELEAASSVAGQVTFLTGTAERQPPGGGWLGLSTGSKVMQGDRLRTKDNSRLEAKLKDGSVLRLGSRSELRLDQVSVRSRKQKKISARLFVGRVWAKVTSLFGSSSKFEVSTENAVAGVRGTRFQAARGEDGSTTVKVYDGKVLVSNKPIYAIEGHTKGKRVQVQGPQEISKQQWQEMVAGAMQVVRVSSGGELGSAEPFKMGEGEDAEWESWNTQRDELTEK